jgi:hypothetical protein
VQPIGDHTRDHTHTSSLTFDSTAIRSMPPMHPHTNKLNYRRAQRIATRIRCAITHQQRDQYDERGDVAIVVDRVGEVGAVDRLGRISLNAYTRHT